MECRAGIAYMAMYNHCSHLESAGLRVVVRHIDDHCPHCLHSLDNLSMSRTSASRNNNPVTPRD